MLKKIPTSTVTLGMFIQSLEGPWLSHPFWKTKFLLAKAEDLASLKASGVAAVWIDVSQGAAPAAAVPTAVAMPDPAPLPAAPALVASGRATMDGELERAAQVLARSKRAVMDMFGEARLGKTVQTDACLAVVDDVAASLDRNPNAFASLARLKSKDDYTYMHSVAVCALMVGVARQLGHSADRTREAALAGLLHDIGKAQMPLDVLNKPGKLTDEEFDVIRLHPESGWELLRGPELPPSVIDVCLHHHEKFDGSGYPHRLAGEQISQLARMGSVCDVYDAITSTRPYKPAWDAASSLQRMAQWHGHFDPVVFRALISSVGIYPTGTLVRLHSGRLAVVVEQSATSLLKPVVRVFYSTRSRMPIPVQLLDLSESSCSDGIAAREPLEAWGFGHLEELWNPLSKKCR